MTYGFSDFDLRAVPTPRLAIPVPQVRAPRRSHASVVGLAVDNLVKWLAWAQSSRRLSFDAVGGHVHVRSVRRRLLYPRHLRRASRWEVRLGLPPRSQEHAHHGRPDADEVARLRAAWEQRWFTEVSEGIIEPLLRRAPDRIGDDVLARYVTDFIWSPRLREDSSGLAAAVRDLRDVLVRIEPKQLASKQAIIDANFGLDGGAHYLLSAVEPDLVLDSTLIDVKLSMPCAVPRRIFEDMVRYCLCFELQTFSEDRHPQMTLWRRVPPRISIERIGLFVADRGAMTVWSRREWLSDAQLVELGRMYNEGVWMHATRHQSRASPQADLFASSAKHVEGARASSASEGGLQSPARRRGRRRSC